MMTHMEDFGRIDYAARDQSYWRALAQRMGCGEAVVEELVKNFAAYARRREVARLLAHYELFKQVVQLPGSVVEVGVYKGASFFTWTSLMETFCPADRHRMVYGFDHFQGLGEFHAADGPKQEGKVDKVEGGWKASEANARLLVELHNADTLLPGVPRCRLIEGDVVETIPRFLDENPGVRVCLLHLDADLYAPTRVALEQFWPLVVPGGVLCFDEYGLEAWAGESRAADEFFAQLPNPPTIRKFSFAATPGGYCIKP